MLRMSLWCDKYRPKTFKELDYGVDQAKKLERMVTEGDFPHLLVFGPEGAGKKTRVNCILRELYGNGVEKLRLERHEFMTQSKTITGYSVFKLQLVLIVPFFQLKVPFFVFPKYSY